MLVETLKRLKIPFVVGALVLGLIASGGSAVAQDTITLRLHHFAPPSTIPHKDYLVPWAERIEEQSNGRLEIELYPAMQLGGSPSSLYDQVRNGTVDMTWTLIAYTPGRFPKTEVFELPFMARDVRATPQAVSEYVEKHASDEYSETHPLTFFSTAPGGIHSTEPVRKPEDLKRLRIRNPTRALAKFTSQMGARPVDIPMHGVPEAVSRGVVDAVTLPLDAIVDMRINEMLGYHTEFESANGAGLYANVLVITMNKERYESLPEDLQQVIDENSGPGEAAKISEAWHERVVSDRKKIRESDSNELLIVDPDTNGWRSYGQNVVDDWVADMGDKGVDGRALYEDAVRILNKHAAKYE